MKVGDLVRVRHNNDRVFPDKWAQGIVIESNVLGSRDLFSVLCSEKNDIFLISLRNDEVQTLSNKN